MANNQTQPQVPKLENLDLGSLLTMLLQSQAETARLQRQLLEREIAKDEATAKKEADAAAKLERLRRNSLDELKRKRENDEKRWELCPHTDQKGGSSIFPISNHPDRQLRGTCIHCGLYIEPAHFEEDANGKRTLIPEHPLYKIVLQRDQALYAEFVPSIAY